jgi:hypothetical protein
MIATLGSIAAMAPYLSVIILGMIAVWIISVYSLDKLFKKAMADQEAEAASDELASSSQKSAEAASSKNQEPATAK